MSKLKQFITSPHIQIALATGVSIIAMAYFSKRILPEPIGYLPTAMPPFLMVIYEALLNRHENSRICTPWYWVVAILGSTALIIVLYMV